MICRILLVTCGSVMPRWCSIIKRAISRTLVLYADVCWYGSIDSKGLSAMAGGDGGLEMTLAGGNGRERPVLSGRKSWVVAEKEEQNSRTKCLAVSGSQMEGTKTSTELSWQKFPSSVPALGFDTRSHQS